MEQLGAALRAWRDRLDPATVGFAHPVIVNVSSGMGSFGMTQDPARIESQYALPLYSASKAAVTMLTTQYARDSRA
ncbi:hypothetical protein OG601_14045 [Streptomyces sp. NBC_01239]|uniref:hypothetical protein n=1 Tax=Streptomyces sp. NBC_01239 TaxID=2903792 RepID=UPI002259C626|nr:hypothetical protein [Streptomyces sp. NBC_01239]MCX4811731.1 hypothetical protein [Streptomyces sp. NBC_01239]